MAPESISDLVRSLVGASVVEHYLSAASAAVLVFDYLLTLDQEVDLIWKRPRSGLTILFFITRYLPFVDTVGVLIYNFATVLTARICTISYELQATLFVVGVCTAECILLTRTAAVWGNSKPIFWTLLVYLLLSAGGVIFLAIRYGSGNPSGSDATSKSISKAVLSLGLCPTSSSEATLSTTLYSAGPWIIVLAYETVLLCLILPKAISARVFGRTTLYDAVYIKGIWFYLCTFAVSVANIIALFSHVNGHNAHLHLLISFDRVMHAIITARLVLLLRSAAPGQDAAQTGTPIPAMEFHIPESRNATEGETESPDGDAAVTVATET